MVNLNCFGFLFEALFFTLALICLPGCTLQTAHMAGLRSADGLSAQYPADAQRLAEAVAEELSRRYAPAQTELALLTVPGQFGVSLESALRSQGFAVLPEASRGVTVGAVADVIQGELRPSGYAEVNTSDGQRFSLVRKLVGDSLLIPTQQEVVAPPFAASEPSGLASTAGSVSTTPLNETATAALIAPSVQTAPALPAPIAQTVPAPTVAVVTPKKNNMVVLPKAVLTVLPYDWRYTIPDTEKRQERVSTPGNVPWRDAIRTMADESGCTASFDEKSRRVTLKANPNAPRVAVSPTTPAAQAAQAVPAAPVSALHPASLPEPASTTPVPSTPAVPESPVVADALQNAASTTLAVPAAQAMPVAAPVAPVVSEPSLPTEPVKTPESSLVQPEIWELDSGSLYACLIRWTERAGYQLVWKADKDLTMESAAVFRGTFMDAVRKLFSGLNKSGHGLRVTFYQSNNVMEVRGE